MCIKYALNIPSTKICSLHIDQTQLRINRIRSNELLISTVFQVLILASTYQRIWTTVIIYNWALGRKWRLVIFLPTWPMTHFINLPDVHICFGKLFIECPAMNSIFCNKSLLNSVNKNAWAVSFWLSRTTTSLHAWTSA